MAVGCEPVWRLTATFSAAPVARSYNSTGICRYYFSETAINGQSTQKLRIEEIPCWLCGTHTTAAASETDPPQQPRFVNLIDPDDNQNLVSASDLLGDSTRDDGSLAVSSTLTSQKRYKIK